MNMDKIEKFLRFSELVGNENEIIEKDRIDEIVKDDYDFISLTGVARNSREPQIDKNGINKALIEADMGIAETGSVVVVEPSENHRRATSLCESLHVILPASRIAEKLEESEKLLKKATAGSSGTYIAFITGASRTADIEMSLTLGVHGPGKMKIFIVKDL